MVPKAAWLKDNLPLIPTPPFTVKAPVLTEDETVEAVIANPDVYKILDDGLKLSTELIDSPAPEELPILEKISKNEMHLC